MRTYLDNAATSFPKPQAVYDAMIRYATQVGASPGRGQYTESREGARVLRQCRERLARLFHAAPPEHIIFALNTSDALNLAIKGVARAWRMRHPGRPMHLITTAMDHNSVLRPFAALAEEGAILTHVEADPHTGVVAPRDVQAAISASPHTPALLALNLVSNVTGTIQPAAEIGAMARAHGVPYLVDAAQGAGHIDINVQTMHIDLLAFPGHKGLLGPQGTGGLYIAPAILPLLATTREGGTGSWSELDAQPTTMPERFEAGSHNTTGLAGLSEAAAWLIAQGIDQLRAHEVELIAHTLRRLEALGCRMSGLPTRDGPLHALRLLGPVEPSMRVAVFSFVHDTVPPAELTAALDTGYGVLARSGVHCAPRAHATLGTLSDPSRMGAVRLSAGPFNTTADMDRAIDALAEVCTQFEDVHAVGPAPLRPAPL